jgi:hypothetical protein
MLEIGSDGYIERFFIGAFHYVARCRGLATDKPVCDTETF